MKSFILLAILFSFILASVADESSFDVSVEKAPLKNEPSMEKLDGKTKIDYLFSFKCPFKCLNYNQKKKERSQRKMSMLRIKVKRQPRKPMNSR